MGAHSIFHRTKESLYTDYNELLRIMGDRFMMFKRFDIGSFPQTNVFLVNRFANLVCRDLCHHKCDEQEIKEKLNILIIKNR